MFANPTIIGEAFVGEGPEAAHLNVVLGRRGSAVESAWVGSLAAPRGGHVPFVTVLQPGLPVKPLTLFVNKAAIDGDRHGMLTWGAAQAGVAAGVAGAVAVGLIPASEVDDLLCIAAVWVAPGATDEEAVYDNNRAATLGAIAAAVSGEPRIETVLAAAHAPANPFFRRGRAGT
jgi:5,6,7,8-tetrahydromethanopterin hydro-lyase